MKPQDRSDAMSSMGDLVVRLAEDTKLLNDSVFEAKSEEVVISFLAAIGNCMLSPCAARAKKKMIKLRRSGASLQRVVLAAGQVLLSMEEG